MQQLSLFEVANTLPVEYYPGFLDFTEADALFIYCRTLQWQQNEIKMLGKPLPVPRLECMYGKEKASYLYSGSVTLDALSWTPKLLSLRDRITAFCGYEFDIVIGNQYRNGQDSIGWHSDDEPSMGYRPAIASISLGACRKFSIKSEVKGSRATHFWLEHGSLLLMLPGCQEGYVHQLPKANNCFLERINLTFRPYGRLK
ncbi:MAG: alpha-ketoglutarate-dependent dioxygenase AlkB [Nostoc sp.]|uniref:alpha-ketoglutarate-dependent dioxygenase AlkB family protein n=1 Tax=Nostoc sp. TaxID=1180 RepID=UPI002FF99EEA